MIRLSFFGAVVEVRVDASLEGDVAGLWSRFVVDHEKPAATAVDLTYLDRREALSELAVKLNALALDVCPHFAMHAGVVDLGGTTLALPGTSGAGKSTLTAACQRVGLGYISDEALCLPDDEAGRVVAYPRPFGLSPFSLRLLEVTAPLHDVGQPSEYVVAPDALGTVQSDPGPLRQVVVPVRTEGPTPDLTPLHRAEAAALLLRLSFNHFRAPAAAFDVVLNALDRAQAWTLRYGDPLAAASFIADRFADPIG